MADEPKSNDQQPQPEGFLHSAATALGVDPEAVAETAKAFYQHPLESTEAVGSETASELTDMAKHPVETAKQAGQGVVDTLTNPQAQTVAKERFSKPGVGNKITGATEYLASGIPMIGGNIVKGMEQGTEGNLRGESGTLVGTLAPMLTDTVKSEAPAGIAHLKATAKTFGESAAEGMNRALNATAPEGSTEAGFAKVGGKQVRPATSFEAVEPTHRVTPKGGEVRIDIGGKNKGMVKYTMGAGEDGASITATNIDPELRGQGHGKAMYTRAAREAEARGAKFITSDLTGTDSYDSGRVWESLMRDHPEAIEKIPSKAGSPGYRWTFENEIPDAGKAPVPDDPAQKQALAGKGQLPGQRVNLGEVGQYVGGLEGSKAYGHPVLNKLADSFGVSNSPSKLKDSNEGAAYIAPDGKFIHLPAGTQHAEAVESVAPEYMQQLDQRVRSGEFGQTTTLDPRKPIINDTGALRVSYRTDRSGPTVAISVPKNGVTADQIPAVRDAIAQVGKNGNVVIERVDATPETKDALTMKKEFPRAADAENYLKQIQAHPDQHAAPKGTTFLSDAAQEYNKQNKLPPIKPEAVEPDPRQFQIADAYKTATHAPNNPAVKKSYDALKQDIDKQYELAQKLGIKMDVKPENPYGLSTEVPAHEELHNDILNNKHLSVWSGGAPPADHPLSAIDPKTGLTYNEKFRMVHDIFGHAKEKADFSPAGEESAWQQHRQMFSPEAQPALATETRGQAAYTYKYGDFPPQKAAILPTEFQVRPEDINWHETAAKSAAKNDAGGINPINGKSDTTGMGVEVMPELRQPLDHAPTAEDFKNFYDQHKEIFDKHPELRVGWDNNSAAEGGHEINVGAVGPNAAKVAKKLDQKAAFDIGKGDIVPTGGTGLRTSFPNYPLEERMKDLRGEPQSNIKGFEHVTKSLYDNLAPDERDYIKDNPGLQKTVMSHYHRLAPSINETSNAMQAGAALGGWWQRYMDVFHGILDDGDKEKLAQQIGPSHAEVLKQWHAALSGNKAVEDANNLAWHSYADWLDAGKPTDRKSLNDIVVKNGAQFTGEKRGNAALSDTLDWKGKVLKEGLDTTKLYNLVNSPEMKGDRPFSGDVFRDDEAKNPLMGKDPRNRKIASMGATVAGKGNLNRLVIDTHIMDFYGQKSGSATAARYLADSAHLRQAAQDLGLKPGEGQEQLWGTVLGLKTLLKEGLTSEEAGGKLSADTIRQIGKDYAEVIANDPEITKPGGLLDRLQQEHGIGTGSTGFGAAYSKASGSGTGGGGKSGSTPSVSPSLIEKTAERIRGTIDPSKIKTPGQGSLKLGGGDAEEPAEGDTSFNPETFRQNTTADMSDPDARFGAARHEASHVVVSEMLRPGSITGVGLDEHGGYTNAMPPKNSAEQLNNEDLRNLLAVSYAGGMGEPGGTTQQHVSNDMAHRAEMIGQDAQKFAKAPELDAEAVARVNALMADPKVRSNIDRLTTEINKRGHLSGDEVRAVLATK